MGLVAVCVVLVVVVVFVGVSSFAVLPEDVVLSPIKRSSSVPVLSLPVVTLAPLESTPESCAPVRTRAPLETAGASGVS